MRKGDWLQTYTGVQFWPLDPRPEEIYIADIAHALSNLCRFSGHCRTFYSVAQHSLIVSRSVPKQYALWGLLHDSAEAYLVDLPRPLKRHSNFGRGYMRVEDELMRCICARYSIPEDMPAEIKYADNAVLMAEKRDLMGTSPADWGEQTPPLSQRINPVFPEIAETLFLAEFKILHRGD